MDKYSTFWPRYWAGVVDGLVLLPLSLADNYLETPERNKLVLLGWGFVSYSAYWLYSVLLHARFGQTLGKMAMGVKVLDLSETRIPTFKQAVLRDIGYIVLNCGCFIYFAVLVATQRYSRNAEAIDTPAIVLALATLGWFLLEVTTMLTNEKRRALHDYIAGTVVVRNAEQADPADKARLSTRAARGPRS
jgi:uncharacterized RDD family membrane protein YckC